VISSVLEQHALELFVGHKPLSQAVLLNHSRVGDEQINRVLNSY
jgi:hypothetical protein